MAVSSPPTSEIPSLTPPFFRPGRCGDSMIAADSLESRPSSCDPLRQKTESIWVSSQVEDILGMLSIGGKLKESRRKSEESLHRLWESIDLSEPDQLDRWRFLPKWAKDDVVLCQIAGLSRMTIATQENFSQTWERLGKEFEEREKLRSESSPAGSWSSFTSLEDDDLHSDYLDATIQRKPIQESFTTTGCLKGDNFPPSSLPVLPDLEDDSYMTLIDAITERAQSQERKLQELGRYRNSRSGFSRQDDSTTSLDDLERGIIVEANPSTLHSTSLAGLSPRMTPSLLPDSTYLSEEEKFPFSGAHVIQGITDEFSRRASSLRSKSPTSSLPLNPPSDRGIVTPILSPEDGEQFHPGITKETDREKQNSHLSAGHNSIGKRKRAVSYPSLALSLWQDDKSPVQSIRPSKRMRIS